ncbi:MAG: septum site-determining protein MinC [Lachnospiraceae bacterium]|nr:septum site-determining protein MinC [Lachnospiraceae bacterium]
MKNSVVIKGNKYGIIVMLDNTMPFEELKEAVASKFKESSKFLGDSAMGITFEGRFLENDEIRELLDVINENSDLNIVCVVDNDKEREEYFKKSVEEHLTEMSGNEGQFYRGTLRSGQVIESETSIVVLGDVNPGAKIVSSGNVIILGSLKGTVYAGVSGRGDSFVVALEMEPMQIRIGDYIARAADDNSKKSKKKKPETKIAFVEDGNIYIEPLNKEVLNDIKF